MTELELNNTESRLILDFYLYGREFFSTEELVLFEGESNNPQIVGCFDTVISRICQLGISSEYDRRLHQRFNQSVLELHTHEVWTKDQISLFVMDDGKITLDLWHSYIQWAWGEGRDPADGLKGLSQEQLRIWGKKYMKAMMTQYKTGQ